MWPEASPKMANIVDWAHNDHPSVRIPIRASIIETETGDLQVSVHQYHRSCDVSVHAVLLLKGSGCQQNIEVHCDCKCIYLQFIAWSF